MALLVTDTGAKELLERGLKQIEGSKLHLFSNNYTATNGTIIGDLTECAVSGYSAITLAAATWTVTTATNITTANYAEQTFTLTTTGSAYGYYVSNSANTVLLWAETFTGAPFALPAGGGAIKITLNIIGD
jgi:hypothetical protein